jgi:hypothetical protein
MLDAPKDARCERLLRGVDRASRRRGLARGNVRVDARSDDQTTGARASVSTPLGLAVARQQDVAHHSRVVRHRHRSAAMLSCGRGGVGDVGVGAGGVGVGSVGVGAIDVGADVGGDDVGTARCGTRGGARCGGLALSVCSALRGGSALLGRFLELGGSLCGNVGRATAATAGFAPTSAAIGHVLDALAEARA